MEPWLCVPIAATLFEEALGSLIFTYTYELQYTPPSAATVVYVSTAAGLLVVRRHGWVIRRPVRDARRDRVGGGRADWS